MKVASLCIALLCTMAATAQGPDSKTIRLENERVKVTEIVYLPNVPRERFIRPTDEIIVFLDDCKYRRIDSGTGEATVRERKAGETIWHNQGEDAPVLVNLGSKPYRTLLIELKK